MARTAGEREGDAESRARGYWRANLRLQIGLLAVWAIVGYVLSILLADPLNNISFGGFPLGFWFAQQGSIIVFVILIFLYARGMDRVDDEYDVREVELGQARKTLEEEGVTGEGVSGDRKAGRA